MRDLASGPRRFVELQRVLPGISTEQLRSRLNRMVADGMLTRKRYREVPPRVDYELTDRARDLMPVLAALARWGYEWTWGEPRSTESVDIGAIFRLAPGTIEPAEPARTLELVVPDAGYLYTLTISGSGVELTEGRAENPDARVRGNTAAWVAALSPGMDRGGLEISGSSDLADAVLDQLGPAPLERAAAHGYAAA